MLYDKSNSLKHTHLFLRRTCNDSAISDTSLPLASSTGSFSSRLDSRIRLSTANVSPWWVPPRPPSCTSSSLMPVKAYETGCGKKRYKLFVNRSVYKPHKLSTTNVSPWWVPPRPPSCTSSSLMPVKAYETGCGKKRFFLQAFCQQISV